MAVVVVVVILAVVVFSMSDVVITVCKRVGVWLKH